MAVQARKQKIFRSVFQTDISQPTPLIQSTEFGQPFGGPSTSGSASTRPRRQASIDNVSDQVKWDRAWHVVTSRIQLPPSVTIEDSFGALPSESQDSEAVFYEALPLVLDPTRNVPRAKQTEDILLWHARQVRQHFVNHVLPLLSACACQPDVSQVVTSTINTLEAAHRQYLWGLTLVVRGIQDGAASEKAWSTFRRDLHAIIGNSWTQGLVDALNPVLRKLLRTILGTDKPRSVGAQDSPTRERHTAASRNELLGLLESLRKVGLAGDKFQVLFAELMDNCMQDFITTTYAKVWDAQEVRDTSTAAVTPGCIAHLCDWVENQYGRLAVEVFSQLGGHVAWTDVEQWRDIAIGRLATLRIKELFDIVLHWPESKGGLDDLGHAVTTPQRRLQLTDAFSATLQRRLLHPGRSTLEILQTYISMIRTFHALDHSKVLLDRVVHALQLYLCQRDDAIRIVVTGLLSNPSSSNAEEAKTKLVEMAIILNEASQQQRTHAEDEELDWDDMSWVPDPVDAGVNYKRPKNEDVIGTLIGALGSQDIFIKEFQSIIAERLLSKQAGFQQEIKVLGLLKNRFGENSLQNCDVMVKDIQDSRRLDAVLRRSLRNAHGGAQPMSYHSKILSRLFWPSLPKETFKVPPPVEQLQSQYEAGFEQLKSSRKLGWLDNLGSATVQLDLEDRSIEMECKTYEAAVIYEFQEGVASAPGPQQRTFNEILEKLMIDEDLLELALQFWVSKRVLRHTGDQNYVVLERLDSEDGEGELADTSVDDASDHGGPPSPKKPKNVDSAEQERKGVYWQFIVGMLTNSAPAMPLSQISMMMKMLISDGCSWSNEELQEFLGEKIAEGELELAGGKYRLAKK